MPIVLIVMDFIMIVQFWGHLLLARLFPKSSIFDPQKSNFDQELGQNLI